LLSPRLPIGVEESLLHSLRSRRTHPLGRRGRFGRCRHRGVFAGVHTIEPDGVILEQVMGQAEAMLARDLV
jgi:hypothetical protein